MPLFDQGEDTVKRASVAFKKKNGIGYITTKRLAWVEGGQTQFVLSVPLDSIKSLLTTPVGSAKILLKVVVEQDGQEVSHTLNFINNDSATADREEFKNELTACIARARAKDKVNSTGIQMTQQSQKSLLMGSPVPSTNREFELRKRLLLNKPDLAALHRELVVISRELSEDEFWQGREQMLINQAIQESQLKGRSSAMVDPRPTTGDSGDIKITITPQLIHDIFQQYPVVQKAYNENVPEKLSEADFWRRYFSSELFNRTRGTAQPARVSKDEIFDAYLQEEDDDIEPKRLKINHIHRLLDLAATQADHGESGNMPDFTMRAGQNKKSLPLIRQFNSHSQRLLDATIGERKGDRDTDYLKDIIIDDLENEQAGNKIYLHIQDQNRYFESQSSSDIQDKEIANGRKPEEILEEVRARFVNFKPDLIQSAMMDKEVIRKVNEKLDKGVRAKTATRTFLMKGSKTESGLGTEIESQMISCHAATNEFLRHFWLSFGNYDGEKVTVVEKMVRYLQKTDKRVRDIVMLAESHEFGGGEKMKNMLQPMITAIEKALTVYEKDKKLTIIKTGAGEKRPRGSNVSSTNSMNGVNTVTK